MIKGIIFDLDGVIVSTDELHYKAWKEIADSQNIYFDHSINDSLRGVSRSDSLDIILKQSDKRYSSDEKLKLMNDKNNIYLNLLEDLGIENVLPNVLKTLKILKEKGYKLAIGSSSRNAKRILNKIRLIDFFDAISDGTNIIMSKPDPEVFEKAAEMLNLKPEECIVVEDAISGIDAANAAKMLSVGIGDAANYELTKEKIKDISEILQILKI